MLHRVCMLVDFCIRAAPRHQDVGLTDGRDHRDRRFHQDWYSVPQQETLCLIEYNGIDCAFCQRAKFVVVFIVQILHHRKRLTIHELK